MTLISKIIAGSLGLATVGISGFSIYSSMIPKTLGQELESQGFVLVTDDSVWKTLAEKHKSSNNNNPSKISSLDEDTSSTSEDANSMKNKCLKLWNTEIKDNKETKITEIKNWCVTKAVALTTSS